MYCADNGNETYTNPVIYADYPDPSVIRVEKDYYMVSSSFNKMPGIPICHSRDLVNWELIGYAYDRLEISPDYNMEQGKNRYGGGTWAPTVAYNPANGKFYIGACSNEEGEGYLSFVSDKPQGPYKMTVLKEWLYDPGLLIEEGRVFVYYGRDEIQMVELDAEASSIISEPVTVYKNEYRSTLEGTHVHKVGEMYYLSASLCGKDGMKIVCRSGRRQGPFEAKVVGNDGPNMRDAHTHQGGFVDTPDGKWFYFLFQDAGHIGRMPNIQPLTWVEGWPVMGDPLKGFQAVTTWEKPVKGIKPIKQKLGGFDDFLERNLALFWQWNHNPDNSRWSLSERPGYLRLKAGAARHLPEARNMLLQKTIGPWSRGSVKLDGSNMKPGDIAGLAITNQEIPYGFCGVEKGGEQEYFVVMVRNHHFIEKQKISVPFEIYLEIYLDEYGEATFYYSFDHEQYTQIGDKLETFFSGSTFLGYSFGLFCFNRYGEGGYADFDWFDLKTAGRKGNYYSAFEKIHAYHYDSCHDVSTRRCPRHYYSYEVCDIGRGSHICFEQVDFGSGVDWFEASVATPERQGVIELYVDKIYGKKIGELQLTPTGSYELFRALSCRVEEVKGIHRLYLRFNSDDFMHGTFHLDWFQFHKEQE